MTPYIYSDWNAPSITCLFHLLENEGDTMLATEAYVCAVSNITTPFFTDIGDTNAGDQTLR